MLGVQQPRTAAHPTSISPASKAKKLSFPQSKHNADNQSPDSVVSWPKISREEPDEEEEEEENLVNSKNSSNANGFNSNGLSNQKHNPSISDNIDTVEQDTSSSQLLTNGQQNGHFGMGDPSVFGYPGGVGGDFGMRDSLDFVDPSLYLNLDADVVGPSEGEQLEDAFLNLGDDHIGTSKDDPVPVTSGEQEQSAPAPTHEAGSTVDDIKLPSRALTPLSELTPSPKNDGDRSNVGEENGDQADISSSSLRVDLSKLDREDADENATADAGDANAQPSSALTDLSAQPSPTAPSNVEQTAMVDGIASGPSSSKPDVNGMTSQSAPSPDKLSGPSSQPSSSPKPLAPQSQTYAHQSVRPLNPYPMVHPYQNAFASGSSQQLPNLPPLPPREGDTNQKVITVLELNSELFKVSVAFHAQGVAWNSAEAAPYTRKLQSNLAWLATHYDVQQKEVKSPESDPPLPELDAPSLITHPGSNVTLPPELTDRIRTLYQQMSRLFARDYAKRERKMLLARASVPLPSAGAQNPRLSMQMSMAKPTPSPTPSIPAGGLTSIGIKRERSEAPQPGSGVESTDSNGSPLAKRRDTGEGKSAAAPMPRHLQSQTPAPSGPQVPNDANQVGSTGSTPGVSANPAAMTGMGINAMSMARPSSRAGFMPGQNLTMSQGDGAASAAAMLAQGNAAMPGMQMPNLQNMNPQQAAILRQQMQIRQAQMLQRQQLQMQHMQQQQAMAQGQARQMSPSSAATPNQASQPQMGANIGAGANVSGMAMPQNPGQPQGQMMQMPGAAGTGNSALAAHMAAIPQPLLQQVLSNPQHPMIMYLKQTIPNFTMLPVDQQMQRLQLLIVQKQRQQASQHQQVAGMPGTPIRNMSIPNGVSPTQFRQPNVQGAPNVNPQQLAQAQMAGAQPGASGNVYPNVANFQQGMMAQNPSMAAGGAMGMAGQLQPGMSSQQRQLLLMQQQQMARGMAAQGGMTPGMNPAMMNAQALQQQRLAAMQRQGMSPLNPSNAGSVPGVAGMAGSDMNQQQQFAAALRSNPAVPGIARSTRSPSVSELGTPRLGGRVLSGQGQNEEYHRALLQQQQRNAQAQMQQGMMQASSPGQTQQPSSWQNPQQMGQFGAGSPNPGAQGWPQQPGFSHAGSPSATSFPPSRQASSTPAPMPQHSPNQSNSELDIYAWTQNQT